MTPREEGGLDWRQPARAEEFLSRAGTGENRTAHAAAFTLITEYVGRTPGGPGTFLDLGAGSGALAGFVLARLPDTRCVLADISPHMIQAAGVELSAHAGRYEYIEHDMNDDSWPAALKGPFRTIVSSRAIHHLPDQRKAALYAHVFGALLPGGVFANWERVQGPGEVLDASDPHDRNIATVERQLELLRDAGFVEVSCPRHDHPYGLLLGYKAA